MIAQAEKDFSKETFQGRQSEKPNRKESTEKVEIELLTSRVFSCSIFSARERWQR